MVLKIDIKKLGFFIALILVSVSCGKSYLANDEDCTTYDYSNCETTKPRDGELELLFSINRNYIWVPFEIYKGTVDQGELLLRDTAWNSTITYIMPIPEEYSVRAKYERNGQIIYTIDGFNMKATSKQVCDSTCWKVKNYKMDLMIY